MKKVLGLFLVFILLVSIAGIGFAQIEEKKAGLEKIQDYVKSLDQKIERARAAKQISKVSEFKELKRKELERAERLRKEIAKLETEAKAKIQAPKIERKGGFLLGAGFGGGAGIVGVGYRHPIMQNFDLTFNAGLGIGNKYSIVIAGVTGIMPFGNNYAGLEIGLANYSEKVTDLPGLSGTFEKGSRVGLGLFVGTPIGPVRAELGYNSALGLTAGAVYKF